MRKILPVILLLAILTTSLASCGTGITVEIEYVVNGETYQTNTFSGSTLPTLASDPTSDEPCAAFEGWYFDENLWKEPLTLQSLQEIQLKEKASIKVYAHFVYEHDFMNGVCTKCAAEESGSSNAESNASDFFYTLLTNYDGTSTVTLKGVANTTAQRLVIPATINGSPVTEILANTFFALQSLEEVVIPESVTFVQSGAFVNCQNLKKVTFLTNKMKTLYDGTFKGCTALETIVLQNPIIVEEFLSTLPALKTVEFNGTLEESKYGLLLSSNASAPGVMLKCTDGEKLLFSYSYTMFYQEDDNVHVMNTLYKYADIPAQMPDGYIKNSGAIMFSLAQIEAAHRAGELSGTNYFVCDAATVEALIQKDMLLGFDTTSAATDPMVPAEYWGEFARNGVTYALAIPVTKYVFGNGAFVARGNADVAYLVLLKPSLGESDLNTSDLCTTITAHFHQLQSYYLSLQ